MNLVIIKGKMIDTPQIMKSKSGYSFCSVLFKITEGDYIDYVRITGFERAAAEMIKHNIGEELIIKGRLKSTKSEEGYYKTDIIVNSIEVCGDIVDMFNKRQLKDIAW